MNAQPRTTRSTFFQAILLVISLIVVTSLTVSTVFAADTGYFAPKLASTPGKSWTNVTYAFGSDDLYASAKRPNKQLKLSKFTIPGIPGGSPINGIEVSVEGYTAGLQAAVALTYNAGANYTAAYTTALTGSDSVTVLGGPNDNWGRIWTAGDFTDGHFGVKLTTSGPSGSTIYVDQVRVKVYYAAPPTTLVLPPVSGAYGGTTSMSATLTLTADGSIISGADINFYLNSSGLDSAGHCTGDYVGTAATQADTGIATLASASLSGIVAGTYPYGACASYAGDLTHAATAVSSSLTVVGTGTTLVVAPATGVYGNTVDLSATLTYTTGGAPINNEYINFFLFGNPLGSAKTNPSGVATLSNVDLTGYNIGSSNDLTAAFDGKTSLDPSEGSALITIDPRPITVSASSSTKTYDGTTASAAIPHLTAGSIVTGDIAGFTQTFDTPNAGTGKTLTPAGSVDDGNSGLNYTVTFATLSTGTINKAPLTVTADNKVKMAGDSDPAFTFQYSGFVNGETSSVVDTAPACGVSGAHSLTGSYPIVCSGGVDSNYSFTYVNGTLSVVVANINVNINGAPVGSYYVAPSTSDRRSFAIDNGPVKISSINGTTPIIASERVAYSADAGATWPGFSEIMGLPSGQLTSSYVLPWYNNLELNSQLRFGNLGTSGTNVTVKIGGVVMGVYPLAPNQSTRISYAGLSSGPVVISSSGNVPIIASERVAYSPDGGTTWTNFAELMGLPATKLSSTYVMPWYNNVELNTQVRFGNVGSTTTTVTVKIGGVVMGTYSVAPSQSMRLSYPVNNGPVVISSSGNVPIIASERVAYTPDGGTSWSSFTELMGMPQASLTSNYWIPVYDNVHMNTQLRFGNVGSTSTTVTVKIGGVVQGAYTLGPSQSTRLFFAVNGGPVQVYSTNNVPIIVSQRVAYTPDGGAHWSNFAELMALPANQLSTSYVMPWYNNVGLNTELRFAVP